MSALNPIQPVAITAYASLCACGMGNGALYRSLLENTSALGGLSLFDLPFSTPVGEISVPLPEIRPELEAYNSRNSRVALAALYYAEDGLRAALHRAKSTYGSGRIGVVIGTSTSGLYETETAYETLLKEQRMPDDFHFLTRHAYQATPHFLQLELGLNGPCYAISTACSSAAKAMAAGQRLIDSGVCDAVLVGGVDTLCRLTLRGFRSLDLISPQRCRPMDKNRRGINIGEAAGLLLLEKRSGSQAPPLAYLLAVGESSDAHHMSTPHPEGRGAALAMTSALQLAGIAAERIDYVNLHATATKINDRVEARAISEVFGDAVPCSGTKGITGHTLGAAGGVEAIVSLLAMRHGFIPGTCGLEEMDDDCICQVIREPLPERSLQTVMSNSFGFGGNNASMIFSTKTDG